jgi:hypothetical protein
MVCIFSINLIWFVKIKFSVVVDWTFKFLVLDIKFLFIFHQHKLSYSGLMWVVVFGCFCHPDQIYGAHLSIQKQPSTSIRCSWAYVDERWKETRLQTQIWSRTKTLYVQSTTTENLIFRIISNSSRRCRPFDESGPRATQITTLRRYFKE